MNENKMSFDEFVESVKDNIRLYLPDDYAFADIKVNRYQKMNESYLGMAVLRDGQNVVPNINLENYYHEYLHGSDGIEAVMQHMADIVQSEAPKVQISWLQNYETVKEHLFIRVCDVKENEVYLSNVPNKETDGLAVSCHISVDDINGGQASTPVTNDMLEMYGVTADQLFTDAVQNSQRLFPASYNSLANVLMGIVSGGALDAEMMPPMEPMDGPQLMVLTNNQSIHGAASIFYPGQLDAVGKDLGSDFFILPSSIHEVLLVPDDGNSDYRDLQMMVREINQSEVAPADRLSDHVYHYDITDRILEKVETFEHRMAEKEKMKEKAVVLPADKSERKTERDSLLQKLSSKKELASAQPKKNVPNRSRGAVIE